MSVDDAERDALPVSAVPAGEEAAGCRAAMARTLARAQRHQADWRPGDERAERRGSVGR